MHSTIRIVVVLILAGLAGCSQPQVAPGNRRLAESLRTAISAKRTDWLDANASQVDERHTEGELSEEEFQAFSSIIALARAGDWAAAESRVITLIKGQKPMPEDIERLKRASPSISDFEPSRLAGGQAAGGANNGLP